MNARKGDDAVPGSGTVRRPDAADAGPRRNPKGRGVFGCMPVSLRLGASDSLCAVAHAPWPAAKSTPSRPRGILLEALSHLTTRRAFTLLEMLIALTLMSIIAASLYASLNIGFKARDSIRSAIEPVRRAHLALELLRGDLQAALPPAGILAGEFVGQDIVDENGRDADTLLLHAADRAAPASGLACGVRKVELALSAASDKTEPALVRRTTTQLLAPETPAPVEEVLCRNVARFNLRYFDGTNWVDEWNSTTQGNLLPLAVEAAIELRDEAYPQEQSTYRLARVFMVPCGSMGSEQGGTIIRPTPE